ncbi:hypothetical protein [Paenibacillus rhizolycopersici]|uniref:hypothetical protein n=1 Tax=Paenibacillus rhizolycopersici TaxID=2780073 RepID=UPI003D2D89BD
MPVPDLSGVPPWAEFNDLKNKINDIVAKYNNLLVNLDSLNVVSLTADHIDTGTLDANVVTIRSDLTAGAFIQINGSGMLINNGSYNTFTADINGFVTMTGALIQSQTGYPRVVMDPASQLFGAYQSVSSYVAITPIGNAASSPEVSINSTAGRISIFQQSTQSAILSTGSLVFYTNDDFDFRFLNIAGSLNVPFSRVVDFGGLGTSLLQQLSSKAESGINTDSAGPFNGGIPIGTELMVNGGGTVTWVGIAAHSHTQN